MQMNYLKIPCAICGEMQERHKTNLKTVCFNCKKKRILSYHQAKRDEKNKKS